MLGQLEVAKDPNVPKGQCAVLVDGEIVYAGLISLALIPFITPDALLVLNPADFADGENFMKRQLN